MKEKSLFIKDEEYIQQEGDSGFSDYFFNPLPLARNNAHPLKKERGLFIIEFIGIESAIKAPSPCGRGLGLGY